MPSVEKVILPSKALPAAKPTPEQEFNRLLKQLKSAKLHTSSFSAQTVNHPAYLEIISNGEAMIPYILRELQKDPDHWFLALKILAKQFSPVKPEDAGNIKKMAEAWLEWGRQNGKIA